MGYLHIQNFYKDQRILEFEECYSLEKIHGTSVHIKYKNGINKGELTFFSGGEKYANFILLFNQQELLTRFESFGQHEIIVYGEAYGGKQQGMRTTYGDELKFVAFDVRMNGNWLAVPLAEQLVKYLKLEFVSYKRIPCTLKAINAERDADSVQAIRNGMGAGKMREGIVLRPIQECVDEVGDRIITKHKRDEFKEVQTPREIDPEKQRTLKLANQIANEWVTEMRLSHVIDKAQAIINNLQGIEKKELGMEDIAGIIDIMYQDIQEEGKDEFVDSPEVKKAIGHSTALLFKKRLVRQLEEKA